MINYEPLLHELHLNNGTLLLRNARIYDGCKINVKATQLETVTDGSSQAILAVRSSLPSPPETSARVVFLVWYNHLVLPVVFLTRDTCIQGRLVLISLPGQLVTNSCGDHMKPTLLQDRNVHEDYKIIYLRLSLFIECDK